MDENARMRADVLDTIAALASLEAENGRKGVFPTWATSVELGRKLGRFLPDLEGILEDLVIMGFVERMKTLNGWAWHLALWYGPDVEAAGRASGAGVRDVRDAPGDLPGDMPDTEEYRRI